MEVRLAGRFVSQVEALAGTRRRCTAVALQVRPRAGWRRGARGSERSVADKGLGSS